MNQLKQYVKRRPALTRFAWRAMAVTSKVRRVMALPLRGGIVRKYLASHDVKKLQIGAEYNVMPGWLNSDIYPSALNVLALDATRRFPIPDAALDYVFSEHMIEHVTFEQGQFMLRECHRVLKPGGRIRIATPDLHFLTGLFSGEQDELQKEYIRWFIGRNQPGHPERAREVFVINHYFYNWDHRFIYDQTALESSMKAAGFADLKRHAPGRSDDPLLMGIENHGRVLGDEKWNQFETLVIEARKPTNS